MIFDDFFFFLKYRLFIISPPDIIFTSLDTQYIRDLSSIFTKIFIHVNSYIMYFPSNFDYNI